MPCTSDTYIWIEYVIGYARSKNIHQKDRLLQEIGLVRDQSCELFWVHLPTLFGLGGGEEGGRREAPLPSFKKNRESSLDNEQIYII